MTWKYYLLVFTAYLLVTWPTGKLIGWFMRRWATSSFPTDEGTRRMGRHIGYVERIVILAFVLAEHYDAVGLLIAAKSVLRVSDQQVRQQTEYILLGTLLSLTSAVLLAEGTKILGLILGISK